MNAKEFFKHTIIFSSFVIIGWSVSPSDKALSLIKEISPQASISHYGAKVITQDLNHEHEANGLTDEELKSSVPGIYTFLSGNNHSHNFELTKNHFSKLNRGKSVFVFDLENSGIQVEIKPIKIL